MKLLSRLSIAGRIYAAFGALIGLLALLVCIAIGGVQLGAATFNQFRLASAQSANAAALSGELAETQLAFSRYLLTADAPAAEHLQNLVDSLDGAAAPEEYERYRTTVAALIELDRDVEHLTATMEAAGVSATDTLSALITEAAQSSSLNAKAAAVSGLAMQTLLQMRLAANRMLDRPGAAAHASVQELATAGHATLNELRQIFFKADDVAREGQLIMQQVKKLGDRVFSYMQEEERSLLLPMLEEMLRSRITLERVLRMNEILVNNLNGQLSLLSEGQLAAHRETLKKLRQQNDEAVERQLKEALTGAQPVGSGKRVGERQSGKKDTEPSS